MKAILFVGALKNLADRLVAYGTNNPNARALMENLSKQTSLKLFEVTQEQIAASTEVVLPMLKTVPGTMKVHQVSSANVFCIAQLFS